MSIKAQERGQEDRKASTSSCPTTTVDIDTDIDVYALLGLSHMQNKPIKAEDLFFEYEKAKLKSKVDITKHKMAYDILRIPASKWAYDTFGFLNDRYRYCGDFQAHVPLHMMVQGCEYPVTITISDENCMTCRNGVTPTLNLKCAYCRGSGVRTVETKLSIPPNSWPGSFCFDSKQEFIVELLQASIPSELFEVKKDAIGVKVVYHLVHKVHITLLDALLGSKHTISHPNGKSFIIELDPKEQMDQPMVIKEQGLCNELDKTIGDMHLSWNIRLPKFTKKEAKTKIELLLD